MLRNRSYYGLFLMYRNTVQIRQRNEPHRKMEGDNGFNREKGKRQNTQHVPAAVLHKRSTALREDDTGFGGKRIGRDEGDRGKECALKLWVPIGRGGLWLSFQGVRESGDAGCMLLGWVWMCHA